MTGLALPTAAAAALMFTATGAAVVTTSKAQLVSQNATLSASSLQAAVVAAELHDPRLQAIEDNAQDIARENGGARVAPRCRAEKPRGSGAGGRTRRPGAQLAATDQELRHLVRLRHAVGTPARG